MHELPRVAGSKHALLTPEFWLDTLERVVTAVASVALTLIGTEALDLGNFDWSGFWWTILGTAVVRLLLCIVARSSGDKSLPNASFFLTSGRRIK